MSYQCECRTKHDKGRAIIFLLGGGGGSYLGKINCLHTKKINEKSRQQKNFLKKIVRTTLVKLENLLFCNLLDAIICSVR